MKIGIVSDSHGSTRAIDRMLSHPAAEGVTLWLHAGDITPDAEYLAMVTEGKAKVRYVAGNSDWPEPGARYDDVVEAAGHRIFLTHGHMYGVRFTTKMLCDAAGESGCDIAVYGHTHVAEVSTGHITVLNPDGRQKGVRSVTVDGVAIEGNTVKATPGKHEIIVTM